MKSAARKSGPAWRKSMAKKKAKIKTGAAGNQSGQKEAREEISEKKENISREAYITGPAYPGNHHRNDEIIFGKYLPTHHGGRPAPHTSKEREIFHVSKKMKIINRNRSTSKWKSMKHQENENNRNHRQSKIINESPIHLTAEKSHGLGVINEEAIRHLHVCRGNGNVWSLQAEIEGWNRNTTHPTLRPSRRHTQDVTLDYDPDSHLFPLPHLHISHEEASILPYISFSA